MKKMACLFLNIFFSVWLEIRCLKVGTFVLIKFLLTYVDLGIYCTFLMMMQA